MFSTKPTTPITFLAILRPANAAIAPVTAAAPRISNFMSSIPFGGFKEIPPVSKVTPLPTKASGASSPPPNQCIITSRDSRRLPWPTPSSAPIPSFSISASSKISIFKPKLTRSLHRSANDTGYNLFAGSKTRSRDMKTPLASALLSITAKLSSVKTSLTMNSCKMFSFVLFAVKYLSKW